MDGVYIDVQIEENRIDSNQIIPGLLSKVDHCNINVYNICNFTK
jgi:hypothetical protein